MSAYGEATDPTPASAGAGAAHDAAAPTAAGTVLWRPGGGAAVEVAVVHRPQYDDWSLPKGKRQRGESTHAAAVRETAEETGYQPLLGRYVTRVRYQNGVPPVTKTVDYFAANVAGGTFRANEEVDRLRWCTPTAAAELLTYPDDARTVRLFTELPADTTTLLIVRHAQAGNRHEWTGPDWERPLTESGWRQVDRLREFALRYGPRHVHAAPPVRCVQTVEPIATELGQRVTDEPLLSEVGYQRNETAAVDRLLRIAAAGGARLICSQGGVIPDLVSRLAALGGIEPASGESDKGSVWTLSFTRTPHPRLVAAEYVAAPA